MSAAGGHLFVTRGDLTKVACDAWLVPTDAGFRISRVWRRAGVAPPAVVPEGWANDGVRVARLGSAERPGNAPEPWLVNVGGHGRVPTDWFLEGVRQFVSAGAVAQADATPANRRERSLLALPLVGTGSGGAAAVKGDMALQLVVSLADAADAHGVDIVLVTNTPEAFAAAQSARRQLIDRELWSELDSPLRGEARSLADDGLAGRLVLFLGAGVGVGAGLPLWDELLDGLAREAGMDTSDLKALAESLPATDRAGLIERRLDVNGVDLGEAVVALIASHTRVSLVHQLLAGLPVREVATTNYDRLYETAVRGAGRSIAVLPYEPDSDADGWLLKMHGTLDAPDDIVLTRQDYLRYAERRAALAGIVQALLITRRMLFVGFSLSDDNFHRIAHDVRSALGSGPRSDPFATALLPWPDRILEELWSEDMRFVSVGAATEVAAASRGLEIFLDYVLFLTSTNAVHLLDEAYSGVLTEPEQALKEHLRRFIADTPPEAQEASAWGAIERLLDSLGRRPGDNS